MKIKDLQKSNNPRKIIEMDIEEKYVIFEDNPKVKVPLKSGSIVLDVLNKKLMILAEYIEQ
jgi:hypothetical protein